MVWDYMEIDPFTDISGSWEALSGGLNWRSATARVSKLSRDGPAR